MEYANNLGPLLELDRRHIWHPYSQVDGNNLLYLVESAQGSYLHLKSGERVVDGMSSWWTTIHGYNHPVLNQALIAQSQKMAHVMFGGLTHEPAIHLAERLVAITPTNLKHVFYADSGSVAVEVAIKMALQYWSSQGQSKKQKLLSFYNGYHGDTFAAMSVCDPVNGMHHLFDNFIARQIFAEPPTPGFNSTPSETEQQKLRDLFTQHHAQLAAVTIEPIVQGAGGMRICSKAFLAYLRELCDEFNVLLICDEIATGFGRTGALFAVEHATVEPDILCLGKALTGGYLSFAATLCSEQVAKGICEGSHKVLMHGPTFMANPLACAVSIASIDLLLGSPWQSNVHNIQTRIQAAFEPLTQLEHVADVRALGAVGVIELTQPVDMNKITKELIRRGVWLRPFGKLVYTMPMYNMSEEDLQKLLSAMTEVVSSCDIFS